MISSIADLDPHVDRGVEPFERAPVFDALLTPHRSLCDRSLGLLLLVVLAATAAIALGLALVGLWPGSLFVGFDGLFLAGALVACQRDRSRSERVVVDETGISVERRDVRGRVAQSRHLPALGLMVSRRLVDGELVELAVSRRTERLILGADLTSAERAEFSQALIDALHATGIRPRLETIRRSHFAL